jgi:hypothetical protein
MEQKIKITNFVFAIKYLAFKRKDQKSNKNPESIVLKHLINKYHIH